MDPSRVVVPGDELAVIEEYLPGDGTYVDGVRGVIRASWIGRLRLDRLNRRVEVVNPLKVPRMPRQDSLVIGVITSMKDELALVTIYASGDGTLYNGPFAGILHISQASETYVKSMYDIFRLSDVLLAKVLTGTNPFQLSTKAPNLGVLLSLCSACGTPLAKKGGNLLVCRACGNVERRKVSTHYSKVALRLGAKNAR